MTKKTLLGTSIILLILTIASTYIQIDDKSVKIIIKSILGMLTLFSFYCYKTKK